VEDRKGKLVQQILAAVLLTSAALAQAGAASGTFTVNGERIALVHAYASAQKGFFDPKAEDIRILLTDVPLTEPYPGDAFQLARLARDGKLHAVEVIVNARGEPMTGALFLGAFNGMASVSGMHRFEPESIERTRIAGRLFTDAPRTFGSVTYQYDATFSASIPRPPTAEETAAALASPPAISAGAHLKAVRGGLEGFVATLTSEAARKFEGTGGAERFAEIRAETPVNSRVVALTNTGDDTRIATVQGTRGEIVVEFSLKLRRVGDSWKVER